MMSQPRLPYRELSKDAYLALASVNAALGRSTLGQKLCDLVFLRVSQINGCAFCVNMHSHDLVQQGEDVQRLLSVPTWRETELFDARECAALNWAERLTTLPDGHPADADFEALKAHFSDTEIADLTFAVAVINAWNRLGVGMQLPVTRRTASAA
ncbi:carboxymuconolactone decarboxylase family protein [Mycetohabitans endofungorum]|uniref:carboxymuconolactone decarboxylase family protein n=1 Tax=Mycetohabitans endofungorum TaxID=417203 RepID=UPI003BB1C031